MHKLTLQGFRSCCFVGYKERNTQRKIQSEDQRDKDREQPV